MSLLAPFHKWQTDGGYDVRQRETVSSWVVSARPHRLCAPFRPHTTAAVSLQWPAGCTGPQRHCSPPHLFNTGTNLALSPFLPPTSHTDSGAKDKEELTYRTGVAKQSENQRWLGWTGLYCLTSALTILKKILKLRVNVCRVEQGERVRQEGRLV